MLCLACQDIFKGECHRGDKKPHHATISDLYHAVQNKCGLCTFFWESLLLEHTDWGCLHDGLTGEERSCALLKKLVAACWKGDLKWAVEWKMYWIEDNPWLKLRYTPLDHVVSFTLTPSPGGCLKVPLVALAEEQNDAWQLSLAKAWLDRCIATHPKCQSEKSTWVPTRLLELGSSSDEFVRLVHTKTRVVNKPYMTLSHCWGTAEFFKLTTKSLSVMLTGIRTDTLSPTFQDAIKTARCLGVEYLWIDALCILQDSEEDWELESALMGKVYGNGLCNLAATGSKNGEGGLFLNDCKRYPPMTYPFSITSSWENKINGSWDVRLTYLSKGYLLNGPLLDRGWVVQERVMARRNLHFGSQQLYWECHQHDACESYTQGLPEFSPIKDELLNFKHSVESVNVRQDLPNQSASKMLKYWAQIVCTFSQCQLTREEDKLPALSGIAKAIQPFLANGEYLAGLSRDGFAWNLLWRMDFGTFDDRPPRRPRNYRAPSWSWASIDGGRVVMASRSDERYSLDSHSGPEVQVINVKIDLLTSDPTGQVKDGSLQLFGPLMTSPMVESSNPADAWLFGLRINNVWCLTTNECPDVVDESIGAVKNLHIIPIQKYWINSNGFYCLLLQPTGLKRGQFKRYGYTFLQCSHYKIHDWESVENEEWFEFEENDGHGRSTFSII